MNINGPLMHYVASKQPLRNVNLLSLKYLSLKEIRLIRGAYTCVCLVVYDHVREHRAVIIDKKINGLLAVKEDGRRNVAVAIAANLCAATD